MYNDYFLYEVECNSKDNMGMSLITFYYTTAETEEEAIEKISNYVSRWDLYQPIFTAKIVASSDPNTTYPTYIY